MSQTLRPGGLLDLTEFDFRIYTTDRKPILTDNADSYLARWMNLCHIAVQRSGGEPDAANYLHRWVSDNPAYEEVVYREFWLPTSPWRRGNDSETRRFNRIANVFRDDVLVSGLCGVVLRCDT